LLQLLAVELVGVTSNVEGCKKKSCPRHLYLLLILLQLDLNFVYKIKESLSSLLRSLYMYLNYLRSRYLQGAVYVRLKCLDDVSEFPKKMRDIVISENVFLKASFPFDFDSGISRTFGSTELFKSFRIL